MNIYALHTHITLEIHLEIYCLSPLLVDCQNFSDTISDKIFACCIPPWYIHLYLSIIYTAL